MNLDKLVTSGFALLALILISITAFLAGYTHAYSSIRAETVMADSWMNMDGRCTDCADACIAWEEEWKEYHASLNN